MAPFLTWLLKYGTCNEVWTSTAGKECPGMHAACLYVLTPVLCPSWQPSPQLCQSCLGGAHPQIIFPCAFSHDVAHNKGCELILASCPAHWDNDGFGVNITPGCGQAWDLPAGLDAEPQGEALWTNQAGSQPASALKQLQ